MNQKITIIALSILLLLLGGSLCEVKNYKEAKQIDLYLQKGPK
jgi:hypothetical protein